jgi:hypothetical protein
MPSVPVDGRRQYPKLHVEIINALAGRDPRAGVVEQVGDKYIDKYPPATKTNYAGPSSLPEPEPERPKTPGQALWPNLR